MLSKKLQNKLDKYIAENGVIEPASQDEINALCTKKFPSQYINFIKNFGFLTIHDLIYLWSQPEPTSLVYVNIKGLNPLTTFGENTCGEMLAFNLQNDISVYEIASNGELLYKHKDFNTYISSHFESCLL